MAPRGPSIDRTLEACQTDRKRRFKVDQECSNEVKCKKKIISRGYLCCGNDGTHRRLSPLPIRLRVHAP